MPNQKQEDRLNFIPNKGLGKIEFTFDEKEVIKILGKPTLVNDENFDSIYYHYQIDDADLFFFFHYENGKFDYLTIHPNILYLDGTDITKMNKNDLLNFIKHYHKKRNFNYLFEIVEDELDYSYDYANIGLTIWFEGESISDICLYPSF